MDQSWARTPILISTAGRCLQNNRPEKQHEERKQDNVPDFFILFAMIRGQ